GPGGRHRGDGGRPRGKTTAGRHDERRIDCAGRVHGEGGRGDGARRERILVRPRLDGRGRRDRDRPLIPRGGERGIRAVEGVANRRAARRCRDADEGRTAVRTGAGRERGRRHGALREPVARRRTVTV